MKILWSVTAAVAALAFTAPAVARAATAITVVGQGSASSMPDIATLSLTIGTNNASSAATAASDNNTIYNRLTAAMTALGVRSSQLRTTSYNVNYNAPPQNVQPDGSSGPAILPAPSGQYGYSVSRTVSVTLSDTSKVGQAIDAAIGAGVNNVDSVAFGMANPQARRSQALRAAVADARSQAEAIASAAGLRIVAVRSMQEGYTSMPVAPAPMAMARSVAPPTQIEPSSVSTEATVTMTFDAR
ncbi:MAG: SIMPL domain-containing protein [Candidatus Eremiobacteraeota bacterium]|nr:SIMPL domain-containing protein [Candidatus Eremiobacteraeota bacterium]